MRGIGEKSKRWGFGLFLFGLVWWELIYNHAVGGWVEFIKVCL